MKNINIKFRKLYCRLEEGEFSLHSFITFKKIPLEYKNIDMGNGKGKTVVSKYSCILIIDLYIFVLKFKWFLRLKE